MRAMSYIDDKALRNRLKSAYLSEFKNDLPMLQAEWRKKIKTLTKKGLKLPQYFSDVMTAPFEKLLKWYSAYTKAGCSKKCGQIDYNKYSTKIRDFFMKHADELQISTCNYCEMAYVNVYTFAGRKKGQFDIEHILDKGRCPIIGLSLFNFTCSCQYCNSRLKGTKALGRFSKYNKKNSPTSDSYKYDASVFISIVPKPDASLDFSQVLDERNNYEFKFLTNDKDYQFETKFFQLEERYNAHIVEGLRLVQLYHKYPPSYLKLMSKTLINMPTAFDYSVEAIREDLLGAKFSQRYHRTFEKMNRDVMIQCSQRGGIKQLELK